MCAERCKHGFGWETGDSNVPRRPYPILCRNGKWYASFTVQCTPTRETGSDAVGIDLGCKDAITLSTGKKIAKPDFIKEGAQKVNGTPP